MSHEQFHVEVESLAQAIDEATAAISAAFSAIERLPTIERMSLLYALSDKANVEALAIDPRVERELNVHWLGGYES